MRIKLQNDQVDISFALAIMMADVPSPFTAFLFLACSRWLDVGRLAGSCPLFAIAELLLLLPSPSLGGVRLSHTQRFMSPPPTPAYGADTALLSTFCVCAVFFFFFYCCGWRSAHADRQFPLNFKLSYTINMQIEWVFFLSVYFSLFVGPFNLVCWARCAVEALVSGFTKTPPLTLALGSIVDDMPCARRPPPICWVKGRKQFL